MSPIVPVRKPLRSTFYFSVLVLTILTAGCGATQFYPGPRLPSGEVALLELGDLTVYAIDGQPPPKGSRFEILPGEHTLRATHNVAGYGEQIFTYTFVAEAGHDYRFDMDYKVERTLSFRPWVKDMTEETIVGRWE